MYLYSFVAPYLKISYWKQKTKHYASRNSFVFCLFKTNIVFMLNYVFLSPFYKFIFKFKLIYKLKIYLKCINKIVFYSISICKFVLNNTCRVKLTFYKKISKGTVRTREKRKSRKSLFTLSIIFYINIFTNLQFFLLRDYITQVMFALNSFLIPEFTRRGWLRKSDWKLHARTCTRQLFEQFHVNITLRGNYNWHQLHFVFNNSS
jgi:hypothetical protein